MAYGIDQFNAPAIGAISCFEQASIFDQRPTAVIVDPETGQERRINVRAEVRRAVRTGNLAVIEQVGLNHLALLYRPDSLRAKGCRCLSRDLAVLSVPFTIAAVVLFSIKTSLKKRIGLGVTAGALLGVSVGSAIACGIYQRRVKPFVALRAQTLVNEAAQNIPEHLREEFVAIGRQAACRHLPDSQCFGTLGPLADHNTIYRITCLFPRPNAERTEDFLKRLCLTQIPTLFQQEQEEPLVTFERVSRAVAEDAASRLMVRTMLESLFIDATMPQFWDDPVNAQDLGFVDDLF